MDLGPPQAVFGPELEFGLLRWLGIVLAAGFAWVWMPLFPRITATLAGMFAGPALFAIIGYTFFASCMPADDSVRSERILSVAFSVSIPAVFV